MLPPGQWREVDAILASLAAAVDANDRQKAGRELAQLALCAPGTRVSRELNPAMGDAPRAGPDHTTRVVINHLVHALVADETSADETPGNASGSSDDNGASP